MRRLSENLRQNKELLKETIAALHEEDRRFFDGGESMRARRQQTRDLALAIIEQGSKVSTLGAVLQDELNLRRETRADARSGSPNNVSLATTGSGLVSISSTERDLVRHDDKLVAARTLLLAALEEYNARVRRFSNSDGSEWRKPPAFLELELD